jgi:choline-sulfatase
MGKRQGSKQERDPPPTPKAGRSGSGRALGLLAVVLAAAAGAWLLWPFRSPHPNLLLVTIDTLRADHVGAYGYGLASTPVLDALARRGARFEHAESAVPLTGPSHSTILTGLYPPGHGVRDNVNFVLEPGHPTLATRLKRLGYRTAAFVGAYPVAASLGFAQGFDDFEEGFHVSPVPGQGAERPGNEVADSAIAWLAKVDRARPFFLWMHLYDPHAPYKPPPPYSERFRERPYDGEIAFADAQIGRVLQALGSGGRDKSTLVIAVADHGESLGEHGEATHAVLIYEATLRIPFIVAGPGVPGGRVVHERVATVDIVPTALGLLGLPPPPGLPGRDLRPALAGERLHGEPVYSESLFGRLNCRWSSLRSWTEGDWKLINGAEPELYDLGRDPDETQDRAAQERGRVERMRQALGAALARMAPGGDNAHAVALSPEQQERLRSLGYAGGGSGGAGSIDEPGLPDPRARVHLYERLLGLLASPPAAAAHAADEVAALAGQDPGNPFAQFALASLAYHAGQLARADHAFARTLELDPDRPSIRQYYGRLLRDRERLEESEKQHRIALEQTTEDDLKTRISLAETLIALKKTEEASRLLEDVLKRAPRHLDALGAKGRLLFALGQKEEAISYLRQACTEGDEESWLELASAYILLGQPDNAREAAAQTLRQNPGHPWAQVVIGHCLILEGRRTQGLEVLKRAVKAGPRRPRVWHDLARAFAAAGDAGQAAECNRRAAVIIQG